MNVEVFLGGGARSWKLCQAGATLSRDDGGRRGWGGSTPGNFLGSVSFTQQMQVT